MGGCGRLCVRDMDSGCKAGPAHRSWVQGGASAQVMCPVHRSCVHRRGQCTGYMCEDKASAPVMGARRGQYRGQHRRDAPKGKGCVGCTCGAGVRGAGPSSTAYSIVVAAVAAY